MDKVLTIAGFDPSAGAGLLADIKVFDSFGTYGFGICTAVTVQHESCFESPGWQPVEHILDQMSCLFRVHSFGVAKIGLIENSVVLKEVIDSLKYNNPGIKIIWDPILKSSSGFDFHDPSLVDLISDIIKDLYLLTPNSIEASILGLDKGSEYTNVLVKGGHKQEAESEDLLYMDGRVLSFSSPRIPGAEKHGSGCVFSAAIAASLSKGVSLPEACSIAKEHITDFLVSTDSLLGINRRAYEKA
jgi:hydroxymethylpyrimidine/phosphomethylpyrimidine kinase